MATTNKVFIPTSWVPDKITVSASSQSVALTGLTKSEDSVRVFNNCTEVVYITFSNGSGTAVLGASLPIGIGVTEVFGVPPDITNVNAIGTGATGNIFFSVGKGS